MDTFQLQTKGVTGMRGDAEKLVVVGNCELLRTRAASPKVAQHRWPSVYGDLVRPPRTPLDPGLHVHEPARIAPLILRPIQSKQIDTDPHWPVRCSVAELDAVETEHQPW